ncbi:hypothetical protein NEOLEDRAFT_1136649 [Neolentinus lepideus HHB14362 ss-1]|uniref:Uncharacterized protein n=1 Tax=Neolentinus lepideus HHB14362 ss-1 TaxID=1314782 RepID=A0A165R4Z5_9AGAM|nr:hypothetical protein NEOLEDRAFT_1136649 [Neolentinus lepideus HHB14362 ss-1]
MTHITRVALCREELTDPDTAPLQLRFDSYHPGWDADAEGQVYDVIADRIGSALEWIKYLYVEDMRSYDGLDQWPSRHLIGPFPSRLLCKHRTSTGAHTDGTTPRLICSGLQTLELDSVRFRRTFLDVGEDDFADLHL